MAEFSFEAVEYDVMSMTMANANLGDISILTVRGAPLSGHGTIFHTLRLTTAPWVKLPAFGDLKYVRNGSQFIFNLSKAVSRPYFDHIYQMLLHEKPVRVEVGHGGNAINPFFASTPEKIDEKIDFIRFNVGKESVGEAEEIAALIKEMG